MLTDIFADRYAKAQMWEVVDDDIQRLLIQAFRILAEDLYPRYDNKGAKNANSDTAWKAIEAKLSRELGVETLGPKYANGYPVDAVDVVRNFMMASPAGIAPNSYVNRRLSIVELGFRQKEQALLAMANSPLRQDRRTAEFFAGILAATEERERLVFSSAVDELNERFRRAGARLHYHSGFIQRTADPLLAAQIDEPFWALLHDEKWSNVIDDMKEAIDRRDGGESDPAFYAARSLESAIKVVSKMHGLTTGKERGASNYIDNLSSGLLEPWETKSLRTFFSDVRNPLGHGAGDDPRPVLDDIQNTWAIGFAMVWITALATRGAAKRK